MDTVRGSPLFDKLKGFTALYSPLDIEYQQAYSGPYEDLSCYSDDTVVIAAIKDGIISGFGRPVVAFGTDKVLKGQFRRLYEISPKIFYQDFLEGGRVSAASRFLQERGLAARPFYTQIIDLTKTKEELHTRLRKSYTSLINKNKRVDVVSDIEFLRALHKGMHGKTRSDQTWEIQQKMIKAGQAFTILTDTTATLVYYNESSAYYACVGSTGRAHAAMWHSILRAKALGCKTLELGEQVFYPPDEKAANVSKFKAGFGGQTRVYLRIGEK